MYDTTLIKSKLSCLDYLASRGVTVDSRTNRCVSPIRLGASNKTSFYVSPDGQWWYDFGSGKSGDIITLVAECEYHGDIGNAMRHLGRKYTVPDLPQNPTWKSDIAHLCNRTAHYQKNLTPDIRQYLHDRHLTDADIARLRIGVVDDGYLRGRLFLPYFQGDPDQNAPVVYYATRAMPGSKNPDAKYMKASLDECPSYENIPWGLHTLNRASDTLIISEGYFDALMWETAGYPVLSAITGRFSHAQEPTVLRACRLFSRVFIIYDTDRVSHAGDGFTLSMAELLIKHHIPFVVGHTPDLTPHGTPCKDVNDYVCGGGDVRDLLASAVDGLTYLATTKSTIADLTDFAMSLCRTISKPRLASILDACIPTFGEAPIKELKSKAAHGPSEDMVANEITTHHDLVYVPGLGFHEYDGRVWVRIDDARVMSYADRQYGSQFTSANKIASVCKLLRARLTQDIAFNANPVITFTNGTLDINTDKFRDFAKSDFCTIMLPYDFDRDATAPTWERFIVDVANENPDRIILLQQMAGYILYTDNRLQRFFILQGEGGNGKSVYLDILTRVFGEDNTISIPPEGLSSDFKRIQFKDALVNIVTDVRPNFARDGVREATLQICDGARMSACFKGKDFVEFRTRAKLFYATNPIPYADVVQGLVRRITFCRFERRYVQHPNPDDPRERPIDPELTDRLLTELPGIFLWAYDGYRLLKSGCGFATPPEQAEMTRQFEIVSDPIISFCDEYDGCGDIPRNDIYDEYRTWCEEGGHKPMSRERFFPRFREVMGVRITDEPRRRVGGEIVRFFHITYRDPLASDIGT